MVVPKILLHHAVVWYHHYLQHPGTKRLKETLRLSMYWKGLRTTVQSHVKKCCSCQVNKHRKLKNGKLPEKLVITTPWDVLCVDLIDHTPSKARTRHKLTLCASQWVTHQPAGLRLLNCWYHHFALVTLYFNVFDQLYGVTFLCSLCFLRSLSCCCASAISWVVS